MAPRSPLPLAALALLATSAAAQESHAIFDALVVVADDEKRMEALIDFQNDGYVDALAYWWSGSTQTSTSYRLFSLVNDTTGAFDVGWEVEHGFVDDGDYPVLRAVTGNLNGDALEDFVIFVDHSLHVFHSNGLAAPTLVQQLVVTSGQHVLVDFDGDGLDDLVAAPEEDDTHIFMNSGASGGYQLVESSTPFLFEVLELRAGELTGDGIPDLLTLEYFTENSHRLRIYPGNTDGTLQSPLVFHTPRHGYPEIGDIDGDGDEDIVVFSTDTYYVLERTGPGTWSLGTSQPGGPAYTLADVDANGDLDGICCGGGCCHNTYTNERQSTMHISLNDGTGTFAPAFTLPALGSRFIAGAADLDHDGDMDLIGGRSVYYASGPIKSHPWREAGDHDSNPTLAGDFEGDGDIDYRSRYGHDWRNNGTGKFTQVPATTGPVNPGFGGDFDGDGHLDILTRDEDGSPVLCRGNGAGSALPPEPCAPPGVILTTTTGNYLYSENGLVRDLDGDGDLDLMYRGRLAGPDEQRTRTLLNDGTGWFDLIQDLPTSIAVDVGDVNGDGLLDLIAVQSGTWLLGHHPGQGAGLFDPLFVPISGTDIDYGRNELAVDDWNADGHLDIAIPDNGLDLYWGNGRGAFLHQHLSGPENGGTRWAHSADFNADGWTDLMSGNNSAGQDQALILLRSPDGQSFQDPILQLFHPSVCADFDTDGDMDLLQFSGNTFATKYWIPGRTFHGNSAGRHRQYGVGSPGTGDLRPILGAKGPFRAGEASEVRLLGGRGGAVAQLKVSFSQSNIQDYPFPGMNAYAEPWFRRLVYWLDGEDGVPGAGRKTVTSVVPSGLAGTTLYHQFYVLDPGSPNGWACSNGLEIRYR